jgi:hypothetical protein
MSNPLIGGGMAIKTKYQDFALTKKIYLKSSYSENFDVDKTISISTNLGFIVAELKTNLDKTMFQEASATAHDVKLAVSGAKYYLLCDFLDMTPISSSATDIDEVIILRKDRRIPTKIRENFSTYQGRKKTEKITCYILKKIHIMLIFFNVLYLMSYLCLLMKI